MTKGAKWGKLCLGLEGFGVDKRGIQRGGWSYPALLQTNPPECPACSRVRVLRRSVGLSSLSPAAASTRFLIARHGRPGNSSKMTPEERQVAGATLFFRRIYLCEK